MEALEGLDIQQIRKDFPILHQQVNKRPLVYFDNAATTQKPSTVLNTLNKYYSADNANIHRGIHTLAERATNAFEATRKTLQNFVGARDVAEIVFTKGTTESINLVASTYGRKYISKGDEVIVSGMEHHSNIVPWQLLCEEKGALLKVIPITDEGELDMDAFDKLVTAKTKIVSVVYVSNALGTINPIKEIITKAHTVGAKVLIDGAQASSHLHIDVQALDCDFYTLSAHKVYGPTGVGILYGKREILEDMPPYQGGGEMIKDVSFSGTTYNDIPYKFEAGTPNIAGVVAFNEALKYVNTLGKDAIKAHEDELLVYATKKLGHIDGFKPVGTAENKVSVISFTIEGIHHYDLGMLLDAKGIAVRTGHHCTQPLMERFDIEGTVRASFAAYNTIDEIDQFVTGLAEVVKKFR